MRLLVITSSWPRFDGDYAGHFIRDWVKAVGYPATVLVPIAEGAAPAATPRSNNPTAPFDPTVAPSNFRTPHRSGDSDITVVPIPYARNPRLRRDSGDAPFAHPNPFTVVPIPYARNPRLFYNGGALANLRRDGRAWLQIPPYLLKTLRCAVTHAKAADVIVSHWLIPCGLIGAAAARFAQKPHVAVAHGSDAALIERLPVVGRKIVRRSINIPMGVARGYAAPLRDKFTSALFVGRLEPEKGIDTLAEACRLVPWLHLSIIGAGSCAPPPSARHLGVVPTHEVHRHLAAHDVFVLPSHREGAPQALLEAMALGRPIVATAVGQVPTIARHGREALLVPAGSPRALADALSTLRDDAALRQRLATNAFQRSHDFSWERIGALYREALCDA